MVAAAPSESSALPRQSMPPRVPTHSKAARFPAQQQSCAQQGFQSHPRRPPENTAPGGTGRARIRIARLLCAALMSRRSVVRTSGRGLLRGAVARVASPGRRLPAFGSLQPLWCPLRGPGPSALVGRRPRFKSRRACCSLSGGGWPRAGAAGPLGPCGRGVPSPAARLPLLAWRWSRPGFPPPSPGGFGASGPPGVGAPGAARVPRLVPGAFSARFPAWLFLRAPPPPHSLPERALFLKAHTGSISPASGSPTHGNLARGFCPAAAAAGPRKDSALRSQRRVPRRCGARFCHCPAWNRALPAPLLTLRPRCATIAGKSATWRPCI